MAEAFAEELAGRDGACAADSAMAAAAQRIRKTEDRRMEEVYRIADCGLRIADCEIWNAEFGMWNLRRIADSGLRNVKRGF